MSTDNVRSICYNYFTEIPTYLYYDQNDPTGHTYLESSHQNFILIPNIKDATVTQLTKHTINIFSLVLKEQIYSDTYQHVIHTYSIHKNENLWIANLNGLTYENESIVELVKELVNLATN